MNKYLKEIVFGLLFLIVVVLIIGIIFYEFIPNQIIPEANRYSQTSDTAKLLTQIEEEKQAEQEDKKEEVLKSYEITPDDLSVSSSQQQYEKGKNDPFVDYTKLKSGESSSTDSATAGSTTSRSSNSTIGSSNSSSSTNSSSSSSSSNSSSNTTTSNDNTSRVNTNTLRDVSNTNTSTK